MAQTGYTPIQLYYSSTTTNAPAAGNLAYGELAINITDGKLFYKDNANAIQVIAWKTVPATAGGTGQTSYAVGDLLYANTTTTLAKLADVATGNALISGGVTTAPSWGKIGLTTHVSGTLPTGNGGTGLASFTQGDLLYYDSGTALTALAKNATATRYLSNTGTNNNPAWAQINLANGVTGTLPVGNGGTGIASFTTNRIPYASGATTLTTSAGLTFDGTNFATTGISTQVGTVTYAAGNYISAFANGASVTITLPGPITSGNFCLFLQRDVNGAVNNRVLYFASNRYGSAPALTQLASHSGSSGSVGFSISTSVSTYTQTITITNSDGNALSGGWSYIGLVE